MVDTSSGVVFGRTVQANELVSNPLYLHHYGKTQEGKTIIDIGHANAKHVNRGLYALCTRGRV